MSLQTTPTTTFRPSQSLSNAAPSSDGIGVQSAAIGGFSALLASLFTNVIAPTTGVSTPTSTATPLLSGSVPIPAGASSSASLGNDSATLLGGARSTNLPDTGIPTASLPASDNSVFATDQSVLASQVNPLLLLASGTTATTNPTSSALTSPDTAKSTKQAKTAAEIAQDAALSDLALSTLPTDASVTNLFNPLVNPLIQNLPVPPAVLPVVSSEVAALLPPTVPTTDVATATLPTVIAGQDLTTSATTANSTTTASASTRAPVATVSTNRQTVTTTATADSPLFPSPNAFPLVTPASAGVATTLSVTVTNTASGVTVSNATSLSGTQSTIPTVTTTAIDTGRTLNQSNLVPAMTNLPVAALSTADANPRSFFSLTGIDRPADAVTDPEGLGQIGTMIGGTAQFTRERTDVGDLNSLLRGKDRQAPADGSAVVSAGNNFNRLLESAPASPASNPGTQAKVLTQITDAVAERAQVIRENGNTEIRMRLDPPELGVIDIRIHSHRGELRADITAADPAVRSMIESQLADLRSSLEKSGLDFQSFNLSSGNRSDRGNQPDDSGGSAGFARQPVSKPSVAAQPASVVTPNRGSLLDVTA